jgi:hypothetical protein
VPASAEVFDVPLTLEVYGVAQDLEQLSVLDANGAPLSFFRRTPPVERVERRVTLEASPLYGAAAERAPAIGVTTGERGTTVTVTPSDRRAPAAAGFVLDARSSDVAPSALELDWRALPQPFLLDVRIERSENLEHWRTVGSGVVAALEVGGVEARHARVHVNASAGGYYRITASRAVPDWQLLSATLVSAEPGAAESLTVRAESLPASALPDDALPAAWYFDAGAALPVAAATLKFPADAGFMRADLAASDSLAGPWRPIARAGLFYSLQFEGREFSSPLVEIGRRELRYWRVVPSATNGEPPALELTVPQEYLRVRANGAGPYLLAAGTLAEDAGPDATFASVWADLSPEPRTVPRAALGAQRELGGAAALAAPREVPWRVMALYAALIGGVLVVGAMAVRLAREIQRKPS